MTVTLSRRHVVGMAIVAVIIGRDRKSKMSCIKNAIGMNTMMMAIAARTSR